MLGALAVGIVAALLAVVLSKSIYFFEAQFKKLPFHWMWWPALGGVGVGLGGLLFPQALGVGYSVITDLVNDHATWHLLLGVLLVQIAHLDVRPGLGNRGRYPRPAAYDRRSHGRYARSRAALHLAPAPGPW